MKISVRIEAEIDRSPDGGMSSISWLHVHSAGDNPRFAVGSVQSAINAAATKAVESIDPLVDLRDSLDGSRD